MNRKLFVLPLVSLLVGCNSTQPLKDVFKEIRNTPVSQFVKEEVINHYYGYSLINTTESTVIIDYGEEGTTTTISTLNFAGILHCNPNSGNGSFSLELEHESSVTSYANVLFEDGVYSGSLVDGFPLSLQETYILYKDLIFSWNCTFFSGNVGSGYQSGQIEKESMYKKIANALVVEGNVAGGSFTVSAVGPFVQKSAGVKVIYNNFFLSFENYLLKDYTFNAVMEAKGNGYSMTQHSLITTSVSYFNE